MAEHAPDDPPEVTGWLWPGQEPGRLAFDVGANAGDATQRMLKFGFKQVWAFEPAAESFDTLLARYSGDRRVLACHFALSDHVGLQEMAVMERPIASGQLVSVLAEPGSVSDHAGRGADPALGSWGRALGRREVPCDTLDAVASIAGMPDFVKVDTEGHESLVLMGAPMTIAAGCRWLVEFHDDWLHDDCVRLLEAEGYAVQTIRHPAYPPDSYMYTRHGWIKASREN